MTADGSGQQRPQAGLRQAAGRQPAAGNAAGAQPDVPPATAAPGVIPSASAGALDKLTLTASQPDSCSGGTVGLQQLSLGLTAWQIFCRSACIAKS